MAGEGEDAADKTEAPTQRRIDKARDEGQVALSRDLSSAAGLAGLAIGVAMLLPAASASLHRALLPLIERPHEVDMGMLGQAMRPAFAAGAMLVGTLALLAVLLGAGSTLAQTGLLVSLSQIAPKLSRLSPMAGIKRIVSLDNLVEFLKNLAKLSLLTLAAWMVLRDSPQRLIGSIEWDVAVLLEVIVRDSMRVLLAMLAMLAVIALLDLLWVRMRHTGRLRMSRQDMKEEWKQSDGDPEIKARLKRIRAERSKRRMMAAIPSAEVVVTNPTHYAIALAYDREHAAPKVVAKGVDHLAAIIRREAEKHGVPMVANPPLARALYEIDLDREIPVEHYAAVAEIIAYVWKLRGRSADNRG